MIPSYFYHLALDLETVSSTCPESRPNFLEVFQTAKALTPRQRDAHGRLLNHRVTARKHLDEEFISKAEVLGQDGRSSLSEQQGCEEPKPSAPTVRGRDWRCGKVLSQGVRMAKVSKETRTENPAETTSLVENGVSAGQGGLATKGRFEPLSSDEEELGWGMIRLYRDGHETQGLYDEPTTTKGLKAGRLAQLREVAVPSEFQDEDCTTLCILAVPSYLTPSDFLGFVGEKTRDEVSHFRMIRTDRSNRYMVLMKFRNGKKAREWRREWNGKAFDGIEPETAHVVFISSISFLTSSSSPSQPTSYPTMNDDPFTPSQPPSSSRPTTTKPIPPPTPALIELPTCPVCLERMDESTGLLTILCQHVFHCTCLQKWRGSGCPVCRYTQNDPSKRLLHPHSAADADDDSVQNECRVCHSNVNLWICLICGNVGCGRYDAAHAFSHYNDTGHAFALDMETQRVWDYSSDAYVHRLVQNAHDGKLIDLSTSEHGGGVEYADAEDDYDDFVPRSKLHNAGIEYTSLLTSQLDSQRMYFEGILERAADKASIASQSAEKAAALVEKTQEQLESLQIKHDEFAQRVIPELEKEKLRVEKRAERFEGMARTLEKQWREEKTVTESLMDRIKHLDGKMEKTTKEKEALMGEKAELEETARDLMFSLSGSQKIAELRGKEGGGEDFQGGSVSLPEQPKEGEGGKRKRKGKK